jgi:hypothetical protein
VSGMRHEAHGANTPRFLVHPGYRGMCDAPFPGDSARTFACREAITRDLPLMVCQL